MLLDHPLINQRYFFPRRQQPPAPFLVDCGEARLVCYRAERHPGARTLLHFHGNGEVVDDYVPDFVEMFLSMGVNVFLAEYRGYGGSTGTPSLARMLEDTEPLFRALGLPEERLVVFGRSVGSIYAIELAARHPRIAGLILESGIADPLERILLRVQPQEIGTTLEAMTSEARRLLDHQQKLSRYPGPLLVLHAEHDSLVDASHARRNHAWAAGADKTLRLLPRGDHNSILPANREEYLGALRTFLARP
ncbi:alpha/beta hydrolase [Hyalangium gracile]|uniref:alpha/beta hydrolase n=1 Tax=Hyalangium gracile TaxID=394092 RepID=UPI001CCC52EC|nr:alpha/beta hydrolase [Hyalangium gracile]